MCASREAELDELNLHKTDHIDIEQAAVSQEVEEQVDVDVW